MARNRKGISVQEHGVGARTTHSCQLAPKIEVDRFHATSKLLARHILHADIVQRDMYLELPIGHTGVNSNSLAQIASGNLTSRRPPTP